MSMPIEDSTPLEAIVEGVEKTHSPSPQDDERNREYLIRRAALGDNPTQEEMRAVVAYGIEQPRINFLHLFYIQTRLILAWIPTFIEIRRELRGLNL